MRAEGPFDTLVVSHDSARFLRSCLESVRAFAPGCRIHVVDNASRDGSAELARALAPASLRCNPENRYLSGVWNRFLREADSDVVLLLNPDVVLHDGGFVARSVAALREQPDLVAAGHLERSSLRQACAYTPPVRPEDKHVFRRLAERNPWLEKRAAGGEALETLRFEYADGSCLFLDRRAILELGGFCEELPLYYNDTELSLRIHAAGLRIANTWDPGPRTLTHHAEHGARRGERPLARGIARRALGVARRAARRARTTFEPRPADERGAILAALAWIHAHALPDAGIAVSDRRPLPYPEVTGYLIPTLIEWGERDLARRFGAWLVSIQREDGAWLDPSGRAPYTFDTGQVLKGLLALHAREPGLEEPVRRGCEWLAARVQGSGRVTTPDESQWALPGGARVPESIHLHALEPLAIAAERFGEKRHGDAVERACAYYAAQPGLVAFDTLAHFHAYVLEGLVDLGRRAEAARGMATVAALQRRDGAVPAEPGARWICLPALAQYAVTWFKLGQHEPARRALARLASEQQASGGFRGSVGAGARYFPAAELSWAAKFFLDAQSWRIRASFDADAARFPESVARDDGRLRAIEAALPPQPDLRILDAGCGRGRFAAALRHTRPSAEIWGTDVSSAMLAAVPAGIRTRRGSLLDLPFGDGDFDFVFCVEALEHSVNPAAAVRELLRVTRPGGTLLVIDKDARRRGALELSPWERWFERGEVEAWLREGCDAVSSSILDDPQLPAELFVVWRGRVRRS